QHQLVDEKRKVAAAATAEKRKAADQAFVTKKAKKKDHTVWSLHEVKAKRQIGQ
ncbi:unnamed protein product, partial [Effrenium voratum]